MRKFFTTALLTVVALIVSPCGADITDWTITFPTQGLPIAPTSSIPITGTKELSIGQLVWYQEGPESTWVWLNSMATEDPSAPNYSSNFSNGPYDPTYVGYGDSDWPVDNYKIELWDGPEGEEADAVEYSIVDPNA